MVTLKTIQVILLCIACLSLGFAAGYLAPYRVTKSFFTVDMEGYEMEEGEQDLFGHGVKIVHEVVQFLGEDGKTLFTERFPDFTRKAIKKHYPTLDAFRCAYAQADKKQAILDELAENELYNVG